MSFSFPTNLFSSEDLTHDDPDTCGWCAALEGGEDDACGRCKLRDIFVDIGEKACSLFLDEENGLY